MSSRCLSDIQTLAIVPNFNNIFYCNSENNLKNSIFGVTVVLYDIKILSSSRNSRSHFFSRLFLATSNAPSNSQPASVDNSSAVILYFMSSIRKCFCFSAVENSLQASNDANQFKF
jgi:hypothetical protein